MAEGEPLPDRAVELLAASRPLSYQLAAAHGDVAAVVAAPDVDWPIAAEPHTAQGGVRCAVLPLMVVADVAALKAPSLAHALDEPPDAGQLWCLVLWREAGEERALLVQMRLLTVVTRG